MKNPVFKPRLLALALSTPLLAVTPLQAAVIDNLDEDNLSQVDATAVIYQDEAKTVSNGYVLADPEEGSIYPGIAVYDDAGTLCIMAAKADTSGGTCKLGPDSGKRFKMRATAANKPMDLVFNVTDSGTPNSYRVYGKLTNETGVDLRGYQVQVGFGLGEAFTPSTDADGLSLAYSETTDTGAGAIGKYPGGLFGGSPAEGLPFFSADPAVYLDLNGGQDEDSYLASQVPANYSQLFGDWLTAEEVPTAWFYDFDGLPWTDDKILAWESDGVWYQSTRSLEPEYVDDAIFGVYDATGIDPDAVDFDVDQLTADINTANAGETGWTDVKVKEVVDALVQYLLLETSEVDQGTLDTWAATPVTATADGTVFATWDVDAGDEGLFIIEADDVGQSITVTPSVDVETADGVCAEGDPCNFTFAETMTLDQMRYLVIEPAVADPAAPAFAMVPGYVQGPVEDLANVNMNYAVEVGANVTATWTNCVSDGVNPAACQFTVRIMPIGTTVPRSSSSNGGCVAGNGKLLDPMLPAMVLLSLAYLLRRRMVKAAA